VTAGHIHYGVKGENSPVIVTLFKYETPMNEVSESGTITSENLKGPLAGKPLPELAIAIVDILYKHRSGSTVLGYTCDKEME